MATGDKSERSVFFVALNAVMRAMNEIDGSVHCRGGDAEEYGNLLAEHIL